jgi:hypothetical protein
MKFAHVRRIMHPLFDTLSPMRTLSKVTYPVSCGALCRMLYDPDIIRMQQRLKNMWNGLVHSYIKSHKLPSASHCDLLLACSCHVAQNGHGEVRFMFVSDGAGQCGRFDALQVMDEYIVIAGAP